MVGAGKTGRGFLGRLLVGNEITFIDKNEKLVGALKKSKEYTVRFFGKSAPDVTVRFADALTWNEVRSVDAEVIFVSVGGSNLEDVGRELGRYINQGQRIIVCENASRPAETLRRAIGKDVLIAESTVFCTTTESGGTDIDSEWYPYLQFDAEAMQGRVPQLENIKPIYGFGNFLTRKLYTYNSASCIIAYLGYLKGYTEYADAANDGEILAMLDKNYASINDCMCRKFGYDEADQKEFALLSRNKFTDRTIRDTVLRNGREPQRKLRAGERVVGPLLLEAQYGKDTSVLEKTLAAALRFTPDCETEWRAMLREKGYGNILAELCGLDPEGAVYKRVLEMAVTGNIL